MPPSATANWLALQEIIQKYFEHAPTTNELAKWVESGAALALGVRMSRSTVYRLLNEQRSSAGIYGLTPVGKEERWTYSPKVIEKAKKELTKSAESYTTNSIEYSETTKAAAVASLAKNLSVQGVEELTKDIDELIKTKRAYAKDDIEQAVLDGLRAAVEVFQGGYEQHVKAWVIKPVEDKDWLAFVEMVPELLKTRPDALPILAARFVAGAALTEESEKTA